VVWITGVLSYACIFMHLLTGNYYEKLHENDCHKKRPDMLKMYQKVFGGRDPPGPAGGA